jgi:MFS family permease
LTDSKLRLLPFLAAVFLASMAAGLSRLSLARMMRYELLLPAVVVSSVTTWFMAARAVSATLGGVAVDKNPEIARFQPWLSLLGIAMIVFIISRLYNGYLILAFSAVWGFLAGLTWPIIQMLTSSLAGVWSSTAMSLYFTSGSLGTIVGQYLYGVIPLSNRGLIGLSSSIYVVSAGFIAFGVLRYSSILRRRKARRRAAGMRGSIIRGLTLKSVEAWILFSALASGFLGGALREFLYIYLGEVYGLSRVQLASTLASAGLLSIVVSLAVGPIADKFGVVPVLRGVLVMGFIGSLMLAVPGGEAIALAGLALAQAASRSSLPLTRNAAVFSEERRGSLLGLSNTLSNLGQMSSPIIGGWIYDNLAGSIGPFNAKGLIYMIAALLMASAALTPIRGGQPSGESSQPR